MGDNDILIMIAYFIIIIAAVLRVLAHVSGFAFFPPNFAPIGGLAIFSGMHLVGKKAYLVPVIALAVSDYFIGFYDSLVMLAVYGSFFLIAVLSKQFKSKRNNPLYVGGGAVTASVLFFLITNLAVWALPASFYAPDLSGLMASYIAGIPFFKYTLAGDLFFTGAFFLAYEAAKNIVARHSSKLKINSA